METPKYALQIGVSWCFTTFLGVSCRHAAEVEVLPQLRAMPNLLVIRPADVSLGVREDLGRGQGDLVANMGASWEHLWEMGV